MLLELVGGARRFGEGKRTVGGISQKVLTANLRRMEAHGLAHRQIFAAVPPRVEYSRTGTGRSLKPVLDAIEQRGGACQARFIEQRLFPAL